MRSSPLHILFLLLLLAYLLTAALAGPPEDDDEYLTKNYYSRSCPRFEETVGCKIDYWHSLDSSLSPSLIHLLFFDCAVRGCDASILLNNTGGERRSPAASSLRGFRVIDDIKAELEKTCPETVSCADILVAAAREATLKAGGPYWDNVYGRKDGRVSLAKEAEAVPTGRESITELIDFFDSLGLDILDLVVLSGAHTIGKATCGAIQHRLYNYGGVAGESDPSIDPRYLNYLKRKCRRASTEVDFDPTTPTEFDNEYYRNLKQHMGLLGTDQLLASDSRTEPIVEALASQEGVFKHQFAKSMKNLAETLALEGNDEGEVRINCNFVNEKKK
ncbi:peroxidase 7-like [Zingiber officinale]|uniref:Plant heme peroxidase family profile domain-containing protein n=1 Tax=Zingiber officinale TaxID=94328 RepID=A0A8J5GB91_ZINOF|nr:peroxidase 7-like [Zingiber officinale]KAG6504870.1 hypothetical protein ZIOFF_037218 [Zingiber officinale]